MGGAMSSAQMGVTLASMIKENKSMRFLALAQTWKNLSFV